VIDEEGVDKSISEQGSPMISVPASPTSRIQNFPTQRTQQPGLKMFDYPAAGPKPFHKKAAMTLDFRKAIASPRNGRPTIPNTKEPKLKSTLLEPESF